MPVSIDFIIWKLLQTDPGLLSPNHWPFYLQQFACMPTNLTVAIVNKSHKSINRRNGLIEIPYTQGFLFAHVIKSCLQSAHTLFVCTMHKDSTRTLKDFHYVRETTPSFAVDRDMTHDTRANMSRTTKKIILNSDPFSVVVVVVIIALSLLHITLSWDFVGRVHSYIVYRIQ